MCKNSKSTNFIFGSPIFLIIFVFDFKKKYINTPNKSVVMKLHTFSRLGYNTFRGLRYTFSSLINTIYSIYYLVYLDCGTIF
jgi:hypothetical protein